MRFEHQPRSYDYVLVGGGLQNGLMALAILAHNRSARIALIERQTTLGGSHTWCFLCDDIADGSRGFVEPLVVQRWPGYRVAFPGYQRALDIPFAAITGHSLDAAVTGAILASPGSRLYLGCEVCEVSARQVVLTTGVRLHGQVVIDARGPRTRHGALTTGYCKFLSQEFVFTSSHGLDRPVLVDATVEQNDDGYRYFHTLPLAPDRVLVTETYFSDTPDLPRERLRASLASYAATHGHRVAAVNREEAGVLPMPFSGQVPVASTSGPLVAGHAGGWFHPGTGYSLLVAARLADYVSRTPVSELFGSGLAQLVSEHQRQARYCHRINRTLFARRQPEQRRTMLARFYRLPEGTIRRFHALSMTVRDRVRMALGGLGLGARLGRMRWSGKTIVAGAGKP